MQKSRIRKYLAWLLVFAFVCSSVFVTTGNAEAANVNKRNVYSHRKNIKSVTVRIGGKKVTKKTVTLRKGKKTTLKVAVSPRKAKKRVTYTSSKKSVATVSKKDEVTAKKAGMAKIKIMVSGKGYKKKATWVKIRVVNAENTTPDTPDNTNVPVPNSPIPDTPTPDTPAPNTPEPSTPTQVPNTPEPNVPTPDVQPPVTGNEKSLVVYFSRTGNTKAVAEDIQSLTGSDLVELKTVVPYPSSYDDCLAQAQEERANNARPELSTTISNMSEYDTVYVGSDLGGLHAQIIPKFTSRARQPDDGREIRCNYLFEEESLEGRYRVISQEDDREYCCDIVYIKNDNYYGIDSHKIWQGLRNHKFQVIVASEIEAINSLMKKFGSLVKLVYIHGQDDKEDSSEFKMFVDNFDEFDHVLIFESRKEDVFDQLFRLFRAYE